MRAARRDPLAGWRAWRARLEAAESVATVASVAVGVETSLMTQAARALSARFRAVVPVAS